MYMEIAPARSAFKSSFLERLRRRLVAGVLLVCMSGCATSGSQVATGREDMSEKDRNAIRETMEKEELAMVGVSLAGLGATYLEMGYGHPRLAARTLIGTLIIDLILGGIVIFQTPKDPERCSDHIGNFGMPTYLPPCHYPSSGLRMYR
jgi:hypothetical protein